MHSSCRGQRRTSLVHGVIHGCFLRPLTPSCPTVHFHTLCSKKWKKKKKSTVSSMQPTHSVSKFRIKKEKNSYFLSALQPSQERYNLICHLYFARKNQGALEPKAAFDSWEGRENLTFPVWLRGRHTPWGRQRPWKNRDVRIYCALLLGATQEPRPRCSEDSPPSRASVF